jgi:hypothetical protein
LSFAADYTSPFDHSECVAACDDCSRSIGHFCIPYLSGPKECASVKADEEKFKAALELMLESNAFGRMMDLYKASTAIFICIATAIIFCLAYIYLMSFFAEQIAWAIVGITQVSLFIGCGACIFEYIDKSGSANKITQ